jgi:recombination protein RecA
LIYGKGIPKGVAVVDMAVDYEVIKRKGSWLAYKGETLGQGKEAVAQFLEKNPELEQEVIAEVMAAVGKGIGYVTPELHEGERLENGPNEGLDIEEGILDLSEDEK